MPLIMTMIIIIAPRASGWQGEPLVTWKDSCLSWRDVDVDNDKDNGNDYNHPMLQSSDADIVIIAPRASGWQR